MEGGQGAGQPRGGAVRVEAGDAAGQDGRDERVRLGEGALAQCGNGEGLVPGAHPGQVGDTVPHFADRVGEKREQSGCPPRVRRADLVVHGFGLRVPDGDLEQQIGEFRAPLRPARPAPPRQAHDGRLPHHGSCQGRRDPERGRVAY
ncbi:hypothetical protein AB0I10_24500 [Streptomyces sp. NPDC050636]|uniref:hypothetical protein n=1 Tax=Streptomyces sp. NPDC050636 TaxID=3154510 RepID=UPI003440272F